MLRRFVMAAAVATCGLMLVTGCHSKPKGPMTIPLMYKPDTSAVSGVMTPIRQSTFVVVVDNREKKNAIGQNSEEGVLPVFTKDDPAAFVRDVVVRAINARGGTVVTEKSRAQRVLAVTLTSFWTEEKNTYEAMIRAKAEVLDSSGKSLWDGLVTGTGTNFGKSYSAENYQEVYSKAADDFADKLLNSPGVVATLR